MFFVCVVVVQRGSVWGSELRDGRLTETVDDAAPLNWTEQLQQSDLQDP